HLICRDANLTPADLPGREGVHEVVPLLLYQPGEARRVTLALGEIQRVQTAHIQSQCIRLWREIKPAGICHKKVYLNASSSGAEPRFTHRQRHEIYARNTPALAGKVDRTGSRPTADVQRPAWRQPFGQGDHLRRDDSCVPGRDAQYIIYPKTELVHF